MNSKFKIFYYLIILFFITLYLPWPIVGVVATGGIFFYSLFLNSFQEKWKLLKQRKYIVGMLLFFILILVSIVFSDNTSRGIRYLNTRLPLLIFPLSIGLLNLTKDLRNKILLSFANITTLTSIVCFGYSMYNYTKTQRIDFFYNDNLTLIIGQQSVYIALLVNVAIFIFAYNLFSNLEIPKLPIIISIVFLYIVSYLLASRLNLIVLIVLSLVFSLIYILKNKKILEGVALIFGMMIIGILIQKFNPQTLNRFREMAYRDYKFNSSASESHHNLKVTANQWNGANFRLAAWYCGWDLFKENYLLGVGLGDKRDALNMKYKEKNFNYAIQTKKNVHSTYLDILYSMGIFGFISFIITWLFIPMKLAFKESDYLAGSIVFSLTCALITEVYLDRHLGGMVVGFFMTFLLTGCISHKKRQS